MKRKIVTFAWCMIVAIVISFAIILVFFPPKKLIYTEIEKADFSIVNKVFNDEKQEWVIDIKSKDNNISTSISCPSTREPKNENPSLMYEKKKKGSLWGIFQPEYEFSDVVFIYNCINLIVVPKLKSTERISL